MKCGRSPWAIKLLGICYFHRLSARSALLHPQFPAQSVRTTLSAPARRKDRIRNTRHFHFEKNTLQNRWALSPKPIGTVFPCTPRDTIPGATVRQSMALSPQFDRIIRSILPHDAGMQMAAFLQLCGKNPLPYRYFPGAATRHTPKGRHCHGIHAAHATMAKPSVELAFSSALPPVIFVFLLHYALFFHLVCAK